MGDQNVANPLLGQGAENHPFRCRDSSSSLWAHALHRNREWLPLKTERLLWNTLYILGNVNIA